MKHSPEKNILGHETTLNKFKSTEIISTIFPKYSNIKLEINYTKKTEKFTNIWRLNFVPLKNQWVRGEIREIKESCEMEVYQTKTYMLQQK